MRYIAGFFIARCGFDGIAGARAINQNALLAQSRANFLKTCICLFFIGDINLGKCPAQLGSNRLAALLIKIENADFDTLLGQHAGRRLAQTGRTAGNNCSNI